MRIELFLDEDVHSGLAHALRNRGYNTIRIEIDFIPNVLPKDTRKLFLKEIRKVINV